MLGWLPTGFRLGTDVTLRSVTNFNILDSLITGNGKALVASLRHLVLPAVALSTIPMAVITRMTRASLLEVLSQDYIRTAEAKGLPRRAVILRDAMRNARLPVMTVTGLQVGRLLAGAILTETIFSWPWHRSVDLRGHPGALLPHRARSDACHCHHLRDGEPADRRALRHGGSSDYNHPTEMHTADRHGPREESAPGRRPPAVGK